MRKKRNYQKTVKPDVKYNSPEITKFINNLMYAGNKSTIEKFVYMALQKISNELNKTVEELFSEIINNVKVKFELRSRRVGGATYQIPKVLEEDRSLRITIKFITNAIKQITGCSLDKKIYKVLLDAYNNTGEIKKNYENLNKTVDANQVNSSFRW